MTTFNVWGLPSWINGASSRRCEKIAHHLAQLGSDVVLLQEVWTQHGFEVLSQRGEGADRTWWVASARSGGFFGQNGLLTLSKLPIEGGRFWPFSTARLPDSLMNKGALKVTIRIAPGQRVNIWNVHLQAGGPDRVRSRQLAELIGWIQEADDGQMADIVCGDFNFEPGSNDFLKCSRAIGPSVHQLAQQVELPTWDGLQPNCSSGQALDHIFVKTRRSEQVIHARPWRVFTAARLEDRLSDHMGVEALLSFRGGGEERSTRLVLQTLPPTGAESPKMLP